MAASTPIPTAADSSRMRIGPSALAANRTSITTPRAISGAATTWDSRKNRCSTPKRGVLAEIHVRVRDKHGPREQESEHDKPEVPLNASASLERTGDQKRSFDREEGRSESRKSRDAITRGWRRR